MPCKNIPHTCRACGQNFVGYKASIFCNRKCQHANRPKRPLEERFWEKVEKLGVDECWPWLGNRLKKGYGYIRLGRYKEGKILAHRLSFRIANGSLDPNLDVLHHCDHPWCENPAHLFQGTNLENIQDKIRKDRHAYGEKHSSSKMRDEQVRSILKDPRKLSAIANEYGVCHGTIWLIKTRKTWKHISI